MGLRVKECIYTLLFKQPQWLPSVHQGRCSGTIVSLKRESASNWILSMQYHPATQLKSALKDGEQVSPIPSSPSIMKPDEEGVVDTAVSTVTMNLVRFT